MHRMDSSQYVIQLITSYFLNSYFSIEKESSFACNRLQLAVLF